MINRTEEISKIKLRSKYLRVVTLEDSKTIHNAFFDRGFKGDGKS